MNKTNFFVLPLIGRPINFYKTILLNSWIAYEDENNLQLMLELDEAELYKEENEFILKFLNGNSRFLRLLKKDDPNIVYYLYDISDYKYDIDKYLDGKYSKLSHEYKKSIVKFYSKDSNVYRTLYPSDVEKINIAKSLDVEPSLIEEVLSKQNNETIKLNE